MSDKETIRRGYDELAETYASRRSENEREVAVLKEFLGTLSEPTRLLDAGCGQGTPVLPRVGQQRTAVGLDFSREQLRIAAETAPLARLVHGDMMRLPFRDSVFDAVTAYNSLIHIPLAEHRAVIAEFARVLRPGGKVLISEAPEEFERTNEDWLDSGVTMTWSMAGERATQSQLQDAGFQIINHWDVPDRADESDPKPLFFAARLDT